ncbi:unnamed protein product, partial [Linum tenue]
PENTFPKKKKFKETKNLDHLLLDSSSSFLLPFKRETLALPTLSLLSLYYLLPFQRKENRLTRRPHNRRPGLPQALPPLLLHRRRRCCRHPRRRLLHLHPPMLPLLQQPEQNPQDPDGLREPGAPHRVQLPPKSRLRPDQVPVPGDRGRHRQFLVLPRQGSFRFGLQGRPQRRDRRGGETNRAGSPRREGVQI